MDLWHEICIYMCAFLCGFRAYNIAYASACLFELCVPRQLLLDTIKSNSITDEQD